MKADISKERWRVISDPAAAEVLTDPARRRYLEPFLRAEHTLQTAADTLGVAPSTLAYQIDKLRALGLLALVRTEPRAGMTSKVYRAAATRFFVPFDSTSAATIEELLFGIEVETLRTLVRRTVEVRPAGEVRWGLGIALGDNGKIHTDLLPEGSEAHEDEAQLLSDGAPAVVNNYLTVGLAPRQAKLLQRMLVRLSRQVLDGEDSGEQLHLLHLALVPLDDPDG